MQYACDNNRTTKFRNKISDESKKMAMTKHERNVSKRIRTQKKYLIKDEIIKVSPGVQKDKRWLGKKKWGYKVGFTQREGSGLQSFLVFQCWGT